uniref:Fe2OG dioxygenase domain-containing protein n=1 Tax=viral metagenome TaxID=1070528 RepID=A0A6C0J5R3_9ZZZZ
MFNEHPINNDNSKSKVMVYDKNTEQHVDTECHRWHKSYMHTPKFDSTIKKSYMFSGEQRNEIGEELPDIFKPYFEAVKKETDTIFNQVVINWYYKDHDYIPMHSDWTDGLVKDSTIAVLTFNEFVNEDDINLRTFSMVPRDDSIVKGIKLSIPLRHGLLISMCGDCQKTHRHGVDQVNSNSRRISMTFRNYK